MFNALEVRIQLFAWKMIGCNVCSERGQVGSFSTQICSVALNKQDKRMKIKLMQMK